jgi:hypothetical protein
MPAKSPEHPRYVVPCFMVSVFDALMVAAFMLVPGALNAGADRC